MSQADKHKVLAIVGPTCTGKTALSLFLSRNIASEVICCDSRNVYKYFDLGSAKPSKAEQEEIPHHLIDVAEPDENFTAAQFAELAKHAVEEISSKNKLPIVCGGTGFYARALLEGLQIPQIAPQEALRKALKAEEAYEEGSLHRKLQSLDPATATKLHPRDLFRIIRALEVCLVSGQPFSKQAASVAAPFNVLWIGLGIKDREKLKILIKKRIVEQMEAGMLEEAKELLNRFGANQKLMNTVNYRDLLKHLSGEFKLDEAIEHAERHNYQLARRQMMWFKTNEKINWFYVDEESREKIELSVLEKTRLFLSKSE